MTSTFTTASRRLWTSLSRFSRTAVLVLVAFPTMAVAAPTILYTDITSGPNTGGENNNGAYLSLFGKEFGSDINSVQVYVGSGQVARKIYLGTSLGRPDIQELAVQLGSATTSGPIKVVVGGVSSNTDKAFTVRPGNFYFISPTGNDSMGVKNDITRPYRSANYVQNLSSFQAGDFIIALPGTYDLFAGTDAGANSDTWLRASKSGTAAAPLAFLGYPGHQAVVKHSHSLRIFSNYDQIANWVVGGFIVNLTDCATGGGDGEFILLGTTTTPEVCRNTSSTYQGKATAIKFVNMEANGHDTGGFCSGGDGLIEIMYSQDVKVIGISLHNTSPAMGDNESAHAIYLSARQSGTEVGWNALYNIPATRGVVQVHQDSFSGACWGTKQLTDITIHDNLLHDLAGQEILIDGGAGDIALYNNVIYNNLNRRYSDVIALRGSGGTLNAKLYNNTVYANANTGGAGYLFGLGFSDMPQHVDLQNNIFVVTESRDAYIGTDNLPDTLASWLSANLTGSGNLWFGSSSLPPAWTGTVADPLFVGPLVGDLRLKNPGSPAIDKGVSSAAVNALVTRDYDGNVRPQGTAPDIGAFESTGATLPAPQNVRIQKN